ncbi:hypothetical protein FACS1894217_04500 [Clostridia bacterium]|nr:hypothetical protein FACS1894217_04500 [Clostridia bacterium]
MSSEQLSHHTGAERVDGGRGTRDAGRIAAAIGAKARAERNNAEAQRTAERREIAEMQYYTDNNCFPRPNGYFGAETDAHFFER